MNNIRGYHLCLVLITLIKIMANIFPKYMIELVDKIIMKMNYRATLDVCVARLASEVCKGKENITFWSRK